MCVTVYLPREYRPILSPIMNLLYVMSFEEGLDEILTDAVPSDQRMNLQDLYEVEALFSCNRSDL